MPRKKRPVDYFLFKRNPFRPLYMGGLDFRLPPTRLEQSLSREGIHLWLFRARETARLMAAANKAEYAPLEEFVHICHHIPITKKPATAHHRQPKPKGSRLTDLA